MSRAQAWCTSQKPTTMNPANNAFRFIAYPSFSWQSDIHSSVELPSCDKKMNQMRYCISDSSTAETYCLCTPLGVAHENTYTGSTYFWGSVLISIQ